MCVLKNQLRLGLKISASLPLSRIVSWNIRAGGGKRIEGILSQLMAWQPQVIGLSEFRGTPASQWLAEQLAAAGFEHQISHVNSEFPAKNALLLASRYPLKAIRKARMPSLHERWILAQIESQPSLTLGLMHIPNYTHPKLKYPFMDSINRLIKAWNLGPGLVIGDSNCGKRGIDEAPESKVFFKREDQWMHDIEGHGWFDCFRHLHGARREYSWFSHRNNGFRLDQAFCSPDVTDALCKVEYVWGVDPLKPNRRDSLSDHAAMIVDFA